MKLNLGCGKKRIDGYINIDINPDVNPDLEHDIRKGLPYGDNSIDEVRAYDFLEHIPLGETIFVVEEIWRVLKPGGLLDHLTPSTDGRAAFEHPDHKSFWNINSWKYFWDDDRHRINNGIKARFVGVLKDVPTDASTRVIHTVGRLYAVK